MIFTDSCIKAYLDLDACQDSRAWLDLDKPLEELWGTCPYAIWLIYFMTGGAGDPEKYPAQLPASVWSLLIANNYTRHDHTLINWWTEVEHEAPGLVDELRSLITFEDAVELARTNMIHRVDDDIEFAADFLVKYAEREG